jgi:hypothetical protein
VFILLASLAVAGTTQVPSDAGVSAIRLAEQLIAEVGHRVAGTRAAERAQDWAKGQLERRGWQVEQMGVHPGAVFGCQRGQRPEVVLFLAHTDTVPGTVGANDNAAAVGVLLQMATLIKGEQTPRTVCVGFPDAEESGLRGSRAMANATGVLPGPIDQVMALDLVGHGRLTHNGLGPAFGARRLRALLALAPAEVPWVYRGISQAWVHMERSDHRPFSALGVPASHLMARGEKGVYEAYHTPMDTALQLHPTTMQRAVEAVTSVAMGPALPVEQTGSPAFVLPWLGWVVPGWATWAVIAVSHGLAFTALWGVRRDGFIQSGLRWVAQLLTTTLCFGVALMTVVGFGGRDLSAVAGPALLLSWTVWALAGVLWPWRPKSTVARSLGIWAPLCGCSAMLWAGAPLLALPFAVSAAGVGLAHWNRPLGVLCALWPAAYLLRPNVLYELDFHGLFDATPVAWTLVGLFILWPVLAAAFPLEGGQAEDPILDAR